MTRTLSILTAFLEQLFEPCIQAQPLFESSAESTFGMGQKYAEGVRRIHPTRHNSYYDWSESKDKGVWLRYDWPA